MDKRIVLLVFAGVWIMSTMDLHSNDNPKICRVKNLEETIIFKDNGDFFDRYLADAARARIKQIGKTRTERISALISRFHIDSINAIVEWGGGLDQKYYVVILSENMIYLLSWGGDNISFTKIRILDRRLKDFFEKKIEILFNYTGEAKKISQEPFVLFMTFYKDCVPAKTFYSDFPDANSPTESNSYHYNELGDLIKTLKETVKENML